MSDEREDEITRGEDHEAGIVYIARCPEHGLHDERDACFVCGGPVEQVPMRRLYSDPNSRVDGGVLLDDARQALDAWRASQGIGEGLVAFPVQSPAGYRPRKALEGKQGHGDVKTDVGAR